MNQNNKVPWTDRFINRAGSAWFATVVAFLTLIAGYLTAIAPPDDKLSLLKSDGAWNWVAVWFWMIVVVWFALFWLRQIAESRAVQNLHDLIDKTRETVLTVPPSNFVGDFSRLSTNVNGVLLAAMPRAPQHDLKAEKLEETIRLLLGMIASLAKSYDTRRARYAANVMILEPRKEQEPYFPSSISSELVRQFIPRGYDLALLQGILVLYPALSSFTVDGKITGEQDDRDMLAFGIPEEVRDKRNHSWTVLPGAPLAIVKWNRQITAVLKSADLQKAVQGLDDMRKIRELVSEGVGHETFDIERHVLDEISDFYNKPDQKVRSFLSFPLVDDDGTLSAFGVLNVHSDLPNFLGNVPKTESLKRQETFAGIITPLVFNVASAVKAWHKAKEGSENLDSQVIRADTTKRGGETH
jgi:hypothetical protein